MLLEGEKGLAYWCMPTITLLPTLCCFFLTPSFFFLSFLLPFLSFSYSLVGLLCSLLIFLSCCSVLPCSPPPFQYMADGPFILLATKGFYWFTGVLPNHPLVCQLLSHHHLPVLAVPHPITRQRVLFCLLAHHGISIWIRVDILSHYPPWHAPRDSNSSFPLLGGMSS